ncbi:MAG: hypothetical protein JSR66_34105 [Proteobacteria bacterium]|nr:hypothetical protein [Pseudomonadota bacterium]
MLTLTASDTSVELRIADPEKPDYPLWSLRARWAGNCPLGYYDRWMFLFPVYQVESIFDPQGEAILKETGRYATVKWTTRAFIHHVASCTFTEAAVRALISDGRIKGLFDSPALNRKFRELTAQLTTYNRNSELRQVKTALDRFTRIPVNCYIEEHREEAAELMRAAARSAEEEWPYLLDDFKQLQLIDVFTSEEGRQSGDLR